MANFLKNTLTMPSGAVTQWLTATAPEGWLVCNGDAISRTAYAELFAVISTTYGIGDGSTTFNLPDFRGMFLRGAGTNGSETNSSGAGYSGPNLGNAQDDAMQKITGNFGGGRTVGVTPDGAFSFNAAYNSSRTTDGVNDSYGVAFDSEDSTSPNAARTDDAETRPANFGVNFIIKA